MLRQFLVREVKGEVAARLLLWRTAMQASTALGVAGALAQEKVYSPSLTSIYGNNCLITSILLPPCIRRSILSRWRGRCWG